MAEDRPKKPVGWKAPNDPADVDYVHRMLLTVPEFNGGPPITFMATQPYGPKTDQAIINFQKKQGLFPDAVVSPAGPTITRIRDMMKGHGQRHELEPAKVTLIITEREIGHAYVKGYDGKVIAGTTGKHARLGRFRVPVHEARVGTGDPHGEFAFRMFPVIRFGVRYRHEAFQRGGRFNEVFAMEGAPVGDAFFPKRIPYKFGGFAWLLRDNDDFLLHTGPEQPLYKGADTDAGLDSMTASIGCIMTVGPNGFTKFNDWIRECAFSDAYREKIVSPEQADERISRYKALRCIIKKAEKPPWKPLTDVTSIGGPPPVAG
jgi:hypothetical protein